MHDNKYQLSQSPTTKHISNVTKIPSDYNAYSDVFPLRLIVIYNVCYSPNRYTMKETHKNLISQLPHPKPILYQMLANEL